MGLCPKAHIYTRVQQCLSPCSNWNPQPIPSFASECVPLEPKGGTHSPAGEGVPIRTTKPSFLSLYSVGYALYSGAALGLLFAFLIQNEYCSGQHYKQWKKRFGIMGHQLWPIVSALAICWLITESWGWTADFRQSHVAHQLTPIKGS